MISKLRTLEAALSVAIQDLNALEATEDAFKAYSRQNYTNNPNEATGFASQTVPVSESGKRYADGIGKDWKLESIKPSQFSLTFYWRTTELTDKQIKANIEKLVTCDWQRKLTPLQEAVAYAQANLDAFKEELRELTAAIA